MLRPVSPRLLRPITVLFAALVLLTACDGDEGSPQPSSTSWRNIDLQLPDDWYLVEEAATHLSIANHDLREVDDDGVPIPPDGDVVGMFFTYEPGTVPDDWRRFVEEQVDGGVLESDVRMTLEEDIPATRLIFSYESNGIAMREMVVVIPSRAVVVLAQPVPRPGETDAPELFLEHLDTFLEVVETARFGAPVMD